MKPPVLAALLLSAVPAAATAQGLIALDPIIVSSGLTPLTQDAYGRAHTVLTATEMAERGLVTVQDALRALPGVSVGGPGASAVQVRIRGGEARHVLILIDGVPAKGGDDEYTLSGLETADIDRIEVLRGPQSVLFGSNAASGVINVITRKATATGTRWGGAVELGNGHAASVRVATRGARGGLSFGLARRDDRGYDASGDGGEKDAILRNALSLSGDWQATDALRLGFQLRRSDERFDYDDTNFAATSEADYVVDNPLRFSERDERTGEIWAELDTLGGRLTHRLSLQKSVYVQGFDGFAPTRGQTVQARYRATYALDAATVADSRHRLSLALDRRRDESSLAPTNRRSRTSLALEYQGALDNGLDLQAGVRRDNNNVFDDATTWSVGLSWRIPDSGVRLHGSAGAGVVNPSYYNLFADDGFTLGNPGLRPEKNRGFDLGLEAAFWQGRGLVDVTLFRETLTDEITYLGAAAPDGSGRGTYVNEAGKSPRQGVELTGRLQATDRLSLAARYTFTRARNPDGSVELRRPRHEIGLSAVLDTFGGRGTVSADIRRVIGNFDTQFWGAFATARLPDYTAVNLSASYDLTDSVMLTGRIVNLFDRGYSDVWGYPGRGRTAYVGLQAKF